MAISVENRKILPPLGIGYRRMGSKTRVILPGRTRSLTSSVVWIQCANVTDGRTDGQTDGHRATPKIALTHSVSRQKRLLIQLIKKLRLGYFRPLVTARGENMPLIGLCTFRLKPDNSIALDTLLWLVTDESSEDKGKQREIVDPGSESKEGRRTSNICEICSNRARTLHREFQIQWHIQSSCDRNLRCRLCDAETPATYVTHHRRDYWWTPDVFVRVTKTTLNFAKSETARKRTDLIARKCVKIKAS